MSAKLALL